MMPSVFSWPNVVQIEGAHHQDLAVDHHCLHEDRRPSDSGRSSARRCTAVGSKLIDLDARIEETFPGALIACEGREAICRHHRIGQDTDIHTSLYRVLKRRHPVRRDQVRRLQDHGRAFWINDQLLVDSPHHP